MSVSSHPVEWIATARADAVARQHRAREFAPMRRGGQHVRDDAVELERLWWVAECVDDGVTEPPCFGVLGYHCGPAGSEVAVVTGQLLCGCRLRGLSVGEVAALDGRQPHFLRPDDRAEHRCD